MFNLILFGPPGSGKGTQSEKLIAQYGFKHLSTGDILRNEIRNGTDLGMEAKSLMDQGVLVPDAVVIGMIRKSLEENPGVNGFLFDGFPRTRPQAEALDALLTEKKMTINVVLALQVSKSELIKRLLNRGLTSGRTDDVNEAVISSRIEEYERKTAAVADYYKKFNKVVYIPGEGSVNEIFGKLMEEIEKRQ
ncbi:MAG TPA: adenylate kinase [Puia sp.]|nr:adenylate kinase [Puia sp.]